MSGPLPTPYIETTEEALETFFQALEVVNTPYIDLPRSIPNLSNTSLMTARTMFKEGYKYDSGMGKTVNDWHSH